MVSELTIYKNCKTLLPEIPAHWKVVRIKNIFQEIENRSETGNEELLSVSQYTGVTPKRDNLENEGDHLTNAASLVGYKQVTKGDLVINIMLAWNGSLGISQHDGIVSPAYCVYRCRKEHNPDFFGFLFSTNFFKREFKKKSTGIIDSRLRLYSDKFFSIFSFVPPREEQDKIVNYINSQSEKIDRFIQKKQRFIDLLKEQRQSITNHFVTKGLNSNVKMKQSSIEWLCEMPEHWVLEKCKNVFFEIDSRSKNGEEELLSVSHYDGVNKRSSKNVTMFMAEDYTGYKLCWPGDLVINILWAWMGALGVSKEHGIVSSAYGVYRLKQPTLYNTEFLDLMLRHQGYIAEYFKRSKGVNSSRARMYSNDFFTVPIITPPVDEQTEIVASIKQETRIINIAIDKAEKEIELMKEYRETVIADAVMGRTI